MNNSSLMRMNNACFIVKDATGQAFAYFYRAPLGGQAAHQGRGPTDGGELR